MTKLEAIKEICYEKRNMRPSRASYKRTQKAGKALGLSEAEQIELERFLEFRDRDLNLDSHFTAGASK